MRFEDGRIDQFVSEDKVISTLERDELFVQYRRRAKDYLPVAFQQIKNSVSGSDTGYEDLTEEQAGADVLPLSGTGHFKTLSLGIWDAFKDNYVTHVVAHDPAAFHLDDGRRNTNLRAGTVSSGCVCIFSEYGNT